MSSEPSTHIEILGVPWERSGPGPVRFVATLAQAIHPVRSAPVFAGQRLAPAVRFALLSALPLALVSGIIPYTRTLMFGPRGRIAPIGSPSEAMLVFDVVRAMGISLAVCLAYFLALALPYISLTRAYGRSEMRQVSPRLMLYRGWLVPLSVLIQHLILWMSGSPEAPHNILWAAGLGMMLPLLLLFLAMRQTAHRVCGTGTLVSFVVVIIPFVLLDLVRALSAGLWVSLPG